MPSFSSSEDWRDFRAKLVAGESNVDSSSSSGDGPTGKDDSDMWAHVVSQVETGMLLVANPLMFQSQQEYFAQVRCLGPSLGSFRAVSQPVSIPVNVARHMVWECSSSSDLLIIVQDAQQRLPAWPLDLIAAKQHVCCLGYMVEVEVYDDFE